MSTLASPYPPVRFTATARVYHPSPVEEQEARAGLTRLKDLLPADVDPEQDAAIVYIVGNLAVAGVCNANDDAVTIDDTLAIYRQFERQQVNIEHNRKQIVGFIVKAGLSELGTNRLITDDEARASGEPFNVVTVAALWKVANKELCAFILENAALEGDDSTALSLSFEVGFNDYSIVVLPKGETELSLATQVIPSSDPSFKSWQKVLRINKGSGRTRDGSRVGRILGGTLQPLGQGVVTVPAAAVRGITPIVTMPDQVWSSSVDAGNGYEYSSTQLTLQPDDAAPLLAYAASIPDEHLYPPRGEGYEDSYGPDYGRESEPHVTSLFGLTSADPESVRACVADHEGPMTITLGAVSAFENDAKPYDVLKLDVHSDALHALHHALRGAADHKDQWPTYTPHLTVAYLRKGMAQHYVGDNRFSGTVLQFPALTFFPYTGDRSDLPFKLGTDSVYTKDSMTTTATTRVKIPAGLVAKATAMLNYPKAQVTLSDGRILKDVTVFSGSELELDKLVSLDGCVIVSIDSMTPQSPPQIDDSPVVHPHIDQQFPTKVPAQQANDAAEQARMKAAQNAPYPDNGVAAARAAVQAALANLLSIITPETGVSSVTASTTSTTPSMTTTSPIDSLKQIEAKLKTATTPAEMSEALASASPFVDAIVKASEERFEAAKAAESAKVAAETAASEMKAQLAEAQKTLSEMKAAQASAAAESAFASRMTAIAEAFDLDDEVRAYVVDEVRACADDATFAKLFTKMKKTMKGFTKKVAKAGDSQTVDSQEKTPEAGCGTQGVKSKDGSETVHSVGDDANAGKTKPKMDDDEDDEACKAAAATAIASALANPTDKTDIDTIGDVQANETLMQKMQRAFANGTTIGGVKVSELIKKK